MAQLLLENCSIPSGSLSGSGLQQLHDCRENPCSSHLADSGLAATLQV